MPRRTKFIFGSLSFTSIKAVEKHAQLLRSRYSRGATIDQPEDHGFVSALFSCNVEAEQKRGAGIKRFYWAKSPHHSTDCFWVERLVGPPTEFGVPACIRRIGALNRAALRMAVRPDIDAFRKLRVPSGAVQFVSDFSGITHPIEALEIDHDPPFDSIILEFYSQRQIDIECLLLTLPVDGSSLPVWRPEACIDEFQSFHRRFSLRLVSTQENHSEIKRLANQARRAGAGDTPA